MAENPFNRQLARLRLAYERSALKRFLSWWGRELAALAPARLRAWFVEQRDEVLLRRQGDEVLLSRGGAEGRRLALTAPEELKIELERELARSEERPVVVLGLPAGRVLRRSLVLPLATEENLQQVLGFEMDRQTPFKADQVYFDSRVTRRDVQARQIGVDLAVIPRTVLDAEVAALAPAGLSFDAADALQDERRAGFNLLPYGLRSSRPNVWMRVNLALLAGVLVLLGIVMVQSLANREAALEELRSETDRMGTEARSVAQLRDALKDAIEGANFLTAKKRARPAVVDLLLDVTRRLPNDTWLQRFSVNIDQVQLQGQAKEASALIGQLQQSPVLAAPALQGAITPDARTGKEQFLIAARARLPEPPAAAARGSDGRSRPADGKGRAVESEAAGDGERDGAAEDGDAAAAER